MKEMKSRYMLAYGRRKDISSEEQTYYAHSMNTMRVVKGDKLFSEKDKLCFSILVFQQRLLAVKSEYVSKLESGIRSNRFASIFFIKVSWTTRQNQDAPREIQI